MLHRFTTSTGCLLSLVLIAFAGPLRGSDDVLPGAFYALENSDANGDWTMDMSDAVYLLSHLFLGGPEPVPVACGPDPAAIANGDANGDRSVDLSDGIYLLSHLFLGGPAPVSCDGLGITGEGAARNPNPRAIPVNAKPHGASYGEWSARWWQWAGSIPAGVNPVTDTTGEHCDEGQTGHVWFLAGTFGGEVTRECTIPPGQTLLIPLVNFAADNFVCVDPDSNFTFDELRDIAAANIDLVGDISLVVDGVALTGLNGYRVQSPTPFDVTLPVDDVFAPICGDSYPRVIPSVADGFYVMLAPLSAGEHTITVHGEIPDFGFSTTANYNITVGR
jgi:hypothetical protein